MRAHESCRACGDPIDSSGDEIGLPPVRRGGLVWCNRTCLGAYAEILRAERLASLTITESRGRVVVAQSPAESGVRWPLARRR